MRKTKTPKPRRLPEVQLSQEGERMLGEALADVEAGRVRACEGVDELIVDLRNEAAGGQTVH